MTARRERFLNIKEIFMAPNSGGLIDAENGLVSRRIFIEPEIYIEEVRFARDSPLEGGGFEPSVPRSRRSRSWRHDLLQPIYSQVPLTPPKRCGRFLRRRP